MGGGPVAWFCRRDDIPCTYRTLCAALMRERWQTGALWKDRVPPRRHETLHQVSWMGEPCWRGRGGAAWSSHRDKWETKCAWLLGQRNGTTWPRKRGIARVDKYEIGYKSDGASRIYSEGKYIRGQSSDYRRPTALPASILGLSPPFAPARTLPPMANPFVPLQICTPYLLRFVLCEPTHSGHPTLSPLPHFSALASHPTRPCSHAASRFHSSNTLIPPRSADAHDKPSPTTHPCGAHTSVVCCESQGGARLTGILLPL